MKCFKMMVYYLYLFYFYVLVTVLIFIKQICANIQIVLNKNTSQTKT